MRKMLLLIVLFLASCGSIQQAAKLPLPPERDCPRIKDNDLRQVSDKTYQKIVELYLICTEDIATLRGIVVSANNN